MGVFGKKLRADRRYLSTNVNLFELGGLREVEERGLMVAVEEGRLQPKNLSAESAPPKASSAYCLRSEDDSTGSS